MPNPPNHIRVWRFVDAPEELKALSPHGGDEDWIALVPPKLADEYIGWLEYGPFGPHRIWEYVHPELPGYVVKIGVH